MADVTKNNPLTDFTITRHFGGLPVSVIDIDYNTDFGVVGVETLPTTTAEEDRVKIQDEVMYVLSKSATPIILGKTTGTGQLVTVIYEGDYADYANFEATIQSDIRAIKASDDSTPFSSATVVASTTM